MLTVGPHVPANPFFPSPSPFLARFTRQSSPVNPGLVTIEYRSITTDVFGLTDIGVGAFGMLKGRATYIETAYFDGRIWIERGVDGNGMEYYNVYARDEDDDGNN